MDGKLVNTFCILLIEYVTPRVNSSCKTLLFFVPTTFWLIILKRLKPPNSGGFLVENIDIIG